MTTANKYYVIETVYTGPDAGADRYGDTHKVEVCNFPAIDDSGEAYIDGPCGTTDGWAVYARGVFSSLAEARHAIKEAIGDIRDVTKDIHPMDLGDAVAVYKPGLYATMGRAETAEWAEQGMEVDISADTSDEQIHKLVGDYEREANCQGYSLDADLAYIMQERRQELRDAIEYAEWEPA